MVLFLVLRWDLAGNSLRYWWNGLCLLGILGSYYKVSENHFNDKQAFSWSWGMAFEIILLVGAVIWVTMGMYPDKKPVEMTYPLKGESYFVVHGGDTPIINYHGGAVHSQKYALDINQLNSWGIRSNGIYPSNPGRYAILGDKVYSPIQGTVVQTADSLSDQRPPNMQPSQPAGNNVWVKNDNLYVLFAHLKHNSVRVEEGEQVQAGQTLARVGNTGNTTEPHLHMHAVTNPKLDATPREPSCMEVSRYRFPLTDASSYETTRSAKSRQPRLVDVTEDEFAEIVNKNEARLCHLCRVYTNRKGDEKDLFQEMLIQIWKSLPSFEGEACLSTWIYRLPVNTAISFVREKKTRKEYHARYNKKMQGENTEYTDPRSQESLQLQKLYRAISELNASEKAIITMYLEDFSYSEIAFVTDISENYVGVKLHRIKKKLSNRIGESNGTG